MGIQHTASRTALLLECARPFAEDTRIVPNDATEAMRYGSAFHEICELGSRAKPDKIATKWGPGLDADELHAHAVKTLAFLKDWLAGNNIYGETFEVVGVERHQAVRVWRPRGEITLRVDVRECEFDAESHFYTLRPNEFGATYDVLVANGNRTVVIDYKTGEWGEYHSPKDIPQMMALALATRADSVAVLHTPRAGSAMPLVMYADDVDEDERAAFAKRVHKARKRIGDGSLRPGAQCGRCPARESCPAKDGELLQRAGALVQLVSKSEAMTIPPIDKGQFHMFLAELGRLEKRAREVLRQEVKDGAVIVRPDGKVLVIREKTTSHLSQSSIVRNLGPKRGGALIEKLRGMGVIETETHDELWAVDDK